MESVLEDVSFLADTMSGQTVTVDAELVRKQMGNIIKQDDISRYIL